MKSMQGRRISDGELLKPGDYAKVGDAWIGVTPSGQHCNLRAHKITTDRNGAISAEGFIGVYKELWSLVDGVWTERS